MSIVALPPTDMYRTEALRGLPSDARVDRQSMTIFGAKAMQMGPLDPEDERKQKVDLTTLQQLVAYTNQHNAGAKMRFSHPNMSRDGMGRHVGRAKNARIVGDGDSAYVAIDSKISESARRSPNGNLADYVLDMADETPEDFGLSIVPILDREAMAKIQPDANGLVPIRMKGLRAIDVVDEPAATRGGLFSLNSDSVADLPAQATYLIDTFFGDAGPDVIRGRFDEFLNTYFRTKGANMATLVEPSADVAAKQKEIDTLKAENDALKAEVAAVQAEISALKAGTTPPVVDPVKETARVELSRRSEITALCTLAKVADADRDLFLAAGFSRSEAQDYLKSSGRLSLNNPPISEGGNDPLQKKQTDEEKYGAEFDKFSEIYSRQGIKREQFIASRKKDAPTN